MRDPFGTCPASTTNFYSRGLRPESFFPAGRLDPNAIELLNLYPAPTNWDFSRTSRIRRNSVENRNAFDTRLDLNLSDKNQIFYRFSYVDDPQFIPGIFGGVADGGGFQEATRPHWRNRVRWRGPMCFHRPWLT